MNHPRRGLLVLLAAGLALTGCGTTSARSTSNAAGLTVDESLHAALPAAVRSKGELVVAIDPSYAPMESCAKNGRGIVGMEPDLARELGALLGIRLRTQRGCGEQMRVQQYTTNSDALLRLRTGRAVAVMNDMPPAALLSTDPKTKAFYQLASSTQYESGYFGLAVSKQDVRLRAVLQRAVGRLIADGTYRETLKRWSLLGGAVPTSLVNAGRTGPA